MAESVPHDLWWTLKGDIPNPLDLPAKSYSGPPRAAARSQEDHCPVHGVQGILFTVVAWFEGPWRQHGYRQHGDCHGPHRGAPRRNVHIGGQGSFPMMIWVEVRNREGCYCRMVDHAFVWTHQDGNGGSVNTVHSCGTITMITGLYEAIQCYSLSNHRLY